MAAVLYDERFRDAREFAAALERKGTIAFPIRGSSAGLWYGELRELLRRRTGKVAGMSTSTDLMIAVSCGRESGLRLLFEGAHDSRGTGYVAHRYRMLGAAGLLGRLARESAPRPAELARFLMCMDETVRAEWSTVEAAGPGRTEHPAYFTTWLLGPRPAIEETPDARKGGS